jgi:hypothetical protein
MGLVDSNVNVDYLRMRYLVAILLRDKHPDTARLVAKYNFINLRGICDVQFVKPKAVQYTVEGKFGCYGKLRGHILSELRFRYLAHSYMYEENMSDWATMPNVKESKTAEQLGDSFIDDVIVRYARDLDKDYMLLHPTIILNDTWAPLILKLDKIDRDWRGVVKKEPLSEIRDRLIKTLNERGRLTSLDPRDKVVLAIQTQCLDNLALTRPQDNTLAMLSKQYANMTKMRKISGTLNLRLAKYQAVLTEFESYRREVAHYLIIEYILTFHFKARRIRGEVLLDVEAALDEFYESGVGALGHMIISPDLQFQLLILGHPYVTEVADKDRNELRELLIGLTLDTSLADIEVPTKLPSLPNHTLLTGEEDIPRVLEEIE